MQLVVLFGLFSSAITEKYTRLSTIVNVLESVLEAYQEVSTDMLCLWDRSESGKVSAELATVLIDQFSKRCDVLDSLAKGLDLTVDEQLNRQSTEAAKQYMEGTIAKVHTVAA